MNFCFSHSIHLLIAEPIRTTNHTKTLTDRILTNSAEKVIQSSAIEIGLSGHELIYCTRKTQLLKLNEHYEISIRSIKNCSDETFLEQLRAVKFPD